MSACGNQGAAQNFGGLYFQSGIDQDLSQYNATYEFANFDTYYGSFPMPANGLIVCRTSACFPCSTAPRIGSTFADQYVTPAVSPYNDTAAASFSMHTAANGLYRIGAGIYPYLGLSVAVQAPVLSGSGVFHQSGCGCQHRELLAFHGGSICRRNRYHLRLRNLSSSNTLTAPDGAACPQRSNGPGAGLRHAARRFTT